MPSKERYHKLVKQENKCPRCSRPRDDRNFVECSSCRKRGSKKAEYKKLRASAMSLFGVRRNNDR